MSLQVPAIRPLHPQSPRSRPLVRSSSRLLVLFHAGALLLATFEFLNVWFIMPLPGSQRMRSIDVAYALYQWRWPLRLAFGVLLLAGLPAAFRATGRRRWLAPAALLVVGGVTYVTNFVMAADRMFRQPTVVTMLPAASNKVPGDRLVVGVEVNGEARAYPLMFIGYHHQVRDTVGGRDVLVSYCTVCRTGRVFSPVVEGRAEEFRLVGMDHWNAMFEDHATGSWWRQANGEAIKGSRTGMRLEEIPSLQVTLDQWFALHPASLVMQGDPTFTDEYAKDYAFEKGTSRKALTGTDTTSWGEKSWVVGVVAGGKAMAYDWNRLRRERVINDVLGGVPIVLVLAADSASFFAYVRPDSATRFALRGDSIVGGDVAYAIAGGRGASASLPAIPASQEFWHSWRTFQPSTGRYQGRTGFGGGEFDTEGHGGARGVPPDSSAFLRAPP
ncbi:MAG: hypothetical protein AMXMBFR55_02910 [Gemmatimonadota bacterium]|jgi:hypothetical protein